eukprot:TRINITY_DN3796_c0_g1_i2.p1 TRINITY_DN3796_c0_g1~~TRINITY_DN3796_c0_g1_i2.p1  ORF type:complete len:188 (+),score=27.65 TRINITY_DN3796_c0_g1_i2:92-655(+)
MFPRKVVIHLEKEDEWPENCRFNVDNVPISREEMIGVREELAPTVNFLKANAYKSISSRLFLSGITILIGFFTIKKTSIRSVCRPNTPCKLEFESYPYYWLLALAIIFLLGAIAAYWYTWKLRKVEFLKVEEHLNTLNNSSWKDRRLKWELSYWSSSLSLVTIKDSEMNTNGEVLKKDTLSLPLVKA